ncbi:MAG: iron-sulfur cluster co-chaperone HscB C-terminal domain-containing protein [Chitinophagaceae bacterium]
MNYFELYNIPVSFKPDLQLVKKKFYELSRKYHPDFFSNASDEEQTEVLEKSSMINKAYKMFQNQDEIIKYILQQKGLLQEEEKYQLPPDFLMEVMEVNEQLMDAKMEEDKEKLSAISHQLSDLQNEIYEPVKKYIENYTEDISAEKGLLQVKEYYFKKKYLNRILEGMK